MSRSRLRYHLVYISKLICHHPLVFTAGTVTSKVKFVVFPPICGAISEATVCEICGHPQDLWADHRLLPCKDNFSIPES